MKHRSNTVSIGQLLLLFIGDMIVLLLFVMAGRGEHDMEFSFGQSFITALPFMIAWIPVAALTGAYRAGAFAHGYGKAAGRALLASVIAVPVAMVLRWLMYDKAIWTAFFVVSLIVVTLFMIVWRLLFAFAARKFR